MGFPIERPVRRLTAVSVGLTWLGVVSTCVVYLALGELPADGETTPWPGILATATVISVLAVASIPLVDDRAARHVERSVRRAVQRRIFAADDLVARAQLPPAGRLVSAATDGADKIAALRGGFIATMIGAVTTPLVVVVVIGFSTGWEIAGLMFILLLLAPAAVGGLQRMFRRSSDRHREQSRRLAAEFLDALRGLRTVSLYSRTGQEAERLAAESEAQRRTVMRLLLGNQVILLVTDVVIYGGLIGAATASAVHMGAVGRLDAPHALALVLLAVLLTTPIDHIGQFFYIGMTGVAAEKEVVGLLGTGTPRPPVADRPAASARPVSARPVSCGLKDVDFSHPGRAPTLSHFTLEVTEGEIVALTGPSGAGKSTVLALLSGDLVPDRGHIEFDGAVGDPRVHTAIVHQQTHLFAGSVADNLRLACPDASESRMWEALRQARLDAEIDALPEGLGTAVGEFGTALSGGQAQRLALARGLLRDAPVLILDEVTSHVDPRSEGLIAETIASLAGRKTVVMATHSALLTALAHRGVDLDEAALETARPENDDLVRDEGARR
ncbi:ABC transporter ATP-binding protein [Gordonia aurantiaca]|uniref:ABC transporter ATP-binding protein n=1 Tax=Gordonia sp. B21 TaxID=3151852 RepID=UPI0032641BE9